MSWPIYNLSDLAKSFISGGTPSTKVDEYWTGDIPWITGADFIKEEVILGRRYINKGAIQNSATNIVSKNSILLVTRTGIGKIAIAKEDIAISQDITGIIPNDVIYPSFLIWAIKNKMGAILRAQRGATIKGVTRKDIRNLPIPLPPLSEQRKIVEILDQADALRKLRAEADAKAERILPALFYKMFGDPATNPMGWDISTLKRAGAKVRYGLSIPPTTIDHGVPMIRAINIRRGRFRSENLIHVDISKIPTSKNAKLSEGEVIVVRSGAYTGDILHVNEKLAGSVIGYDLVISPADNLNGRFLEALLLTPYIQKNHFDRLKTRAGQPHLNSNQLLATPVILPPIKMQKKFAQITQSTLDIIDDSQNSKDNLDSLFKTLLHRAFSGDLTAKWREAHMKELLKEMEEQAKALKKTAEKKK